MSIASRIMAVYAQAPGKMSFADIARVVGCNRAYPARLLRQNGVIPPPRPRPPVDAKGRIIAIGAERLATMTAKEIAEAAGCSVEYVWRIMDRCGFAFTPDASTREGPKMKAVRGYLGKGLTARQIAARVGGSPQSVRNAICRIRQQDAAA